MKGLDVLLLLLILRIDPGTLLLFGSLLRIIRVESVGNWWSDYDESGIYCIPGSAGSIDHYPRGPSSSSNTTNTAYTIPGPGEALIRTCAPMDMSVRAILALSIGVLYGALVIIVIKRLR